METKGIATVENLNEVINNQNEMNMNENLVSANGNASWVTQKSWQKT